MKRVQILCFLAVVATSEGCVPPNNVEKNGAASSLPMSRSARTSHVVSAPVTLTAPRASEVSPIVHSRRPPESITARAFIVVDSRRNVFVEQKEFAPDTQC